MLTVLIEHETMFLISGLWHPHDKFYYDVIPSESGDRTPIALRSLVGIIPLLACLNINRSQLQSKSGKMMMKHLDELIQKNSPFVRTFTIYPSFCI